MVAASKLVHGVVGLAKIEKDDGCCERCGEVPWPDMYADHKCADCYDGDTLITLANAKKFFLLRQDELIWHEIHRLKHGRVQPTKTYRFLTVQWAALQKYGKSMSQVFECQEMQRRLRLAERTPEKAKRLRTLRRGLKERGVPHDYVYTGVACDYVETGEDYDGTLTDLLEMFRVDEARAERKANEREAKEREAKEREAKEQEEYAAKVQKEYEAKMHESRELSKRRVLEHAARTVRESPARAAEIELRLVSLNFDLADYFELLRIFEENTTHRPAPNQNQHKTKAITNTDTQPPETLMQTQGRAARERDAAESAEDALWNRAMFEKDKNDKIYAKEREEHKAKESAEQLAKKNAHETFLEHQGRAALEHAARKKQETAERSANEREAKERAKREAEQSHLNARGIDKTNNFELRKKYEENMVPGPTSNQAQHQTNSKPTPNQIEQQANTSTSTKPPKTLMRLPTRVEGFCLASCLAIGFILGSLLHK